MDVYEKMAAINGGKFFGAATSCGKCSQGIMVCTEKFYVFWVPFEKDAVLFPS